MRLLTKLNVMTLSTILASCGSVVVERCNVRILDNKCRCHQYRVERKNPRRVSESTDKPLEYCDNHVSLSPTDWAELLKILVDSEKASKDDVEKAQSLILEFTELPEANDSSDMF